MYSSAKSVQALAAVFWSLVVQALIPHASGAVLEVGPHKSFSTPSAAIKASHDGDTILIDGGGKYRNDVAEINRNNLTIESAGTDRVKIETDGEVFGKKGIWVFTAGHHDLTIRGIEFSGAKISEADGANGAGIRSQGTNLTVINCRFHDNQNGILGGGGTTTIEHCEFDRNGPTGLTHNLYINDQSGKLIFRFNNSHDAVQGHLLKSRSAVNVIQYNRLSDDAGGGSYELDLPNGGQCDVVGNIIHQSAASANGIIIAYGEEGIVDPKSRLNLVHNTIINDRSAATFLDAPKLPAGFKLVSTNNLFVGPGKRFAMNVGAPVSTGDLSETVETAGFADAVKEDYRLKKTSPAAGAGVVIPAEAGGRDLTPQFEYDSTGAERRRPAADHPDVGAKSAAAT